MWLKMASNCGNLNQKWALLFYRTNAVTLCDFTHAIVICNYMTSAHTVTLTPIQSGLQALLTSRTSAAAAAGRRTQMVLSTSP